jgi:hypothetical protein
MSSTEAVEILVKALQSVGAGTEATAVKKTDLRPILALVDPRFQKSTELGATPGLITMLTEFAVAEGRVAILRVPGDAVNPRFSYTASAKSHSPMVVPQRRVSRSQQFINALRDRGLGPFPIFRLRLYKALGQAIADAPAQMSLRAVLAKAINDVQHDQSRTTASYDWKRVTDFLYRLLEREPVLSDEQNKAVAPSLSTLNTRIARIDPDFETKLDAVLMLELVRQFDDITIHDVEALAGALYSDRNTESVERVLHLTEFLVRTNQIVDVPGAGLRLCSTNNQSGVAYTSPVQ